MEDLHLHSWLQHVSFLGRISTLADGFKDFWNFHPVLGEDEPILTSIFQMGRNHHLEVFGGRFLFFSVSPMAPVGFWRSGFFPKTSII